MSATNLLDDSIEFSVLTSKEAGPIILDAAMSNEPIFLFSDPGGGKNSIIGQVANAVGKPMLFPYL
jgi:MoxR-like ATPase